MADPTVEHVFIPASDGLDPVEVFVTVYAPTTARVTAACYGDAWTAFFGAMTGTWREFLAGTSADYLGGSFMQVRLRSSQRERSYVERVSAAIIGHLRAEVRP